MTRARYEIWGKQDGVQDYVVRDVGMHRQVWTDRSRHTCERVCDLLNEAFEAGQRSVRETA